MKFLFSTVCLLLMLYATGCATDPISTTAASPVPLKRVARPDFLNPKPGYSQVIVKRDTGFGASACATIVSANAKQIAFIRTGEKVVFYLPEGDHIIGAEPDGICAGGISETSIRVKSDKPIILRIRYGSSGDFTIQPTAL